MSLFWLVNMFLGEIQVHSACFVRIFLDDNGWMRQIQHLALPDFARNEQSLLSPQNYTLIRNTRNRKLRTSLNFLFFEYGYL